MIAIVFHRYRLPILTRTSETDSPPQAIKYLCHLTRSLTRRTRNMRHSFNPFAGTLTGLACCLALGLTALKCVDARGAVVGQKTQLSGGIGGLGIVGSDRSMLGHPLLCWPRPGRGQPVAGADAGVPSGRRFGDKPCPVAEIEYKYSHYSSHCGNNFDMNPAVQPSNAAPMIATPLRARTTPARTTTRRVSRTTRRRPRKRSPMQPRKTAIPTPREPRQRPEPGMMISTDLAKVATWQMEPRAPATSRSAMRRAATTAA